MLQRPGVSFVPAIHSHAKYRGKQTALICGDQTATWAELNRGVNRVANALITAGLQKGDKVSFLTLNSIDAAAVLFGVMRAGGVVVPISALLTPELIVTLIEDSGSRFIFADAMLQPLVTPILDKLSQIPKTNRIAIGFEDRQWNVWENFLGDAPESLPDVTLEDADEANIIYSSGTTGIPKGIIHTHLSRALFAYGLGMEFRIDSTARTIVTTPLFTNGTWMTLIPTTVAGGTTVMLPMFTPEAFLDTVQKERGTHTFMVPTQFQAIIDHPQFDAYDLSSMRVMVCAGALLPLPLKKRILKKIGKGLMELYGMTEGMGTTLKPEDIETKTGSVGTPISGSDIRIIDDDGQELPQGEIGEIVGYGAGMMKCYHNRPDATAEIVWKDELGRTFLRSGDMGRFDEDGFLYILDRKKDMIISGGVNVFASDIEAVLLQHPDVKDVAVIAIPHTKWGETPLALAIPEPGTNGDPEEIKEWANARLAKHQRVNRVESRAEDFPRNALGKVLKRQLREPYWEEKT